MGGIILIQLRNFTICYIEQLCSWISDEKALFTWAGSAYRLPDLEQQLHTELEESRTDKSKVLLAVWDAKSKEVIGHLQILDIDRHNKTGRIGRVLIGNVKNRNHGVGLEIIQTALDKCFHELGLEEVTLRVFEYNANAIACYEKAGFEIIEDKKEIRMFEEKSYPLLIMRIDREKFFQQQRS
jgi:RimJ/RimL family protein N-acetyltransferase